MANVDKVNGFRPVRYLSGAPWTGKARKYIIPASDAVATAVGDIVEAAAASADGLMAVTRMANGATSTALVGVVVGIDPVDTGGTSLAGGGSNDLNLSNLYRAASTKAYVWVADDPNLIFEGQFDDVGDQPDQTDVGNNYDVVLGSTNTTTGASGMEADSSSEVTLAATPLKLVGLVNRPDNDITDAATYQRGEFILNLHIYKSNAGTAGV